MSDPHDRETYTQSLEARCDALVAENEALRARVVELLVIFGKPQSEEYVDGGASYKLACETVARARAALAATERKL